MKKTLSFITAFVLFMACLVPSFCHSIFHGESRIAQAHVEQNYFTQQSKDLISANIGSVGGNGALEDVAPFNTDTKHRMEGKSITPTADEYGQVKNKEFAINTFAPQKGDVVYMWVYLIDVLTFKLDISITGQSTSSLEWSFDSFEVYSMGTGWKLLALKLSDFQDERYLNGSYKSIIITYTSEADGGSEKYEVKTNERLSFYHVFVTNGDESIRKSGVIYDMGSSFYEFSDEFPFGGTVFVGDKIKLQSPEEIFEYLYIGKYDLTDYLGSGKYYWKLSIENPKLARADIDFGDTVLFTQIGFYRLTIQMLEEGLLSDDVVLNKDISIYCDEATLGRFTMGSSYSFKDNESVLVKFKLTPNLKLNGNYSISLNNNNAKISTYYEESGVVYIRIDGVQGGQSILTITANARSLYGEENDTFIAQADIKIISTEKQVDVFLVIVWIVFACFCVGILIYLVISLVIARKNDVK